MYKHTEKHIKQKKRQIMTPGGGDKTISDTSDYCIMTVTLQYHEST